MKKNFIFRLLQASLMCCLAVLFTACDEVFGSEDNPIPAYLSMDTSNVTLKVGESKTRTAIAVSTAIVEYSSSDPAIATVDANGTVTGVADGTATITATATGYSSASGEKMFNTESKSYKVIVGGGSVAPTALATPLTLEAITAGTIVVKNPQAGMQYSLNGGAKTAVTTTAIDVAIGDKVQFYGNGTTITAYYSYDGNDDNDTKITGGTAQVKVYGNIMSLVNETGYEAATELTGEFAFGRLFYGNTMLTDISELQLPATTLTRACYQNLFRGCTGLTTVPEKLLPATTLANQCYESMFNGCTGLTALPEKLLPATETKPSCYFAMFQYCTGLTTAPELPATTLTNSCYLAMFSGCSNLIATPHLAASALVGSCYQTMFYNCTSLTKAYVKAAYDGTNCTWMFNGCKNVNTCTLYTDGDWSGCTDISSWQTTAYE